MMPKIFAKTNKHGVPWFGVVFVSVTIFVFALISNNSSSVISFLILVGSVFSVWLAFSVPAGVGFYWIWSSVFSFLQSFLLYAYFSPKRIEAINVKLKEKNKNKKPGLMQRMMDQQAEMLKQQEQAKKGGRADYNAETEGMSKSERNKYNRELINEARKRMAEKYGDEYREDDSE